jgi:hypothetical protein
VEDLGLMGEKYYGESIGQIKGNEHKALSENRIRLFLLHGNFIGFFPRSIFLSFG